MPSSKLSSLSNLQSMLASIELPDLPLLPGVAEQAGVYLEHLVASRKIEVGPYALETYLQEFQTQQGEDYFILGMDGHGVQSWAFHFYWVQGPLAFFFQLPWGGAFSMNKKRLRERIYAFCSMGNRVIQATKEAQAGWPKGKSLVIVESEFSASRWAWVARGEGLLDEEEWVNKSPSITEAFLAIKRLSSSSS